MGILSWIIVGLIAGVVANLLFPGPSKGGWFGAMMLGIVGAIVGGFLAAVITGQDFVTGINVSTIAVSIIGALILLIGFNALRPTRT